MAKIYVTGHRNPDVDSLCAAVCYGDYKRRVDPTNTYVPVRCGALSPQARHVFSRAAVEPPALLADARATVGEVARRTPITMREGDPVFEAIRRTDEYDLSVIPVLGPADEFRGMVTIHEISRFFIEEVRGGRPEFGFEADNLPRVIPGRMVHRGAEERFSTYIMIGAMPYEDSVRRMREVLPRKPVLVVGLRLDLIRYAVQEQFPALVLTGVPAGADLGVELSGYRGWIFVSELDTAQTARLLRLSTPVGRIMNTDPPRLRREEDFDAAKAALVQSHYRGLPVFDEGVFYGIVTRRCFIDRPVKQLILVDHNEIAQSVPGAEQAEIREIVDHHRLGAEKTKQPIYVAVKPVGCTCTVVYQHYRAAGIDVSPEIAMLMLAAVLSDTVGLKSPTTTAEDRTAAAELAAAAGVDAVAFAAELFRHAGDIAAGDPKEIVFGDRKAYRDYGTSFFIAQAETATLETLAEAKPALLAELERARRDGGYDWAMLLITNVLKESSVLLCTSYPAAEGALIYRKLDDNLYDLPDVLSRKKQLLPEVLRALEEGVTRVSVAP